MKFPTFFNYIGLPALISASLISWIAIKCAGFAPLYPRLKRDAVILHGIAHGTPLAAVNDRLFEENGGRLY